MRSDSFGNRLAAFRTAIALVSASIRYWRTVAPVVRRELARWERRAQSIEDPELRALALAKLREEGFNAEAGAMLATLAPRRHRSGAVEAIVAVELLFDYLDGLTERPSSDPLEEGARLFTAYTDAVSARQPTAGDAHLLNDSGYLQALSAGAGSALARLPGAPSVSAVLRCSAERAAQAQVQMHAASVLGAGQLERWAHAAAEGTSLEWRELLAGAASSVLAQHALIVAAADPLCTHERAVSIEDAYLSICVVLTLLDGLVDHDRDVRSRDGLANSRPSYASLFEDGDRLVEVLIGAARRATQRAGSLRDGSHHTAILTGVIAFYLSHPGARSTYARPKAERLRDEVGTLIAPALMVMRVWRAIRRLPYCGMGRMA